MVRFPLLEQAHIAPFRAKKRTRTHTDHLIIHDRLEQLRLEGKVEVVSSRDCHIIQEMVLVDKLPAPRPKRAYPDPEVHNRYRITLDLRVLNDLRVTDFGTCAGFIPFRDAAAVKAKKAPHEHQFQLSSLELLSWLPQSTHFVK